MSLDVTESVPRNFKPAARARLVSIFGTQGGLLFDRLDRFCTIVRESGEALLVPPDLDQALHEVLAVRPPLEIVLYDEPLKHEEVRPRGMRHLAMEHMMVCHAFMGVEAVASAKSPSVGRTLGELVEIDVYRERATRTLELLARHNFVSEPGCCYDQPACTLAYTQPA